MSAVSDWAATGRTDSFRAVLVDPFTLQELGEVEADWASCSVTYDYEGDTKAGASLKLADGADYRIGQRQCMLRVYDDITFADGASHTACMGTFFCDFSQGTSLYGREDRELDCHSCLHRHDKDVLRDDFWRAQGYNVSQAIRELVEADGGQLTCAPDANTSKCFGTDIWFEAGESKLETAQTMAGWVGCELMPDSDGRVLMRRVRTADTHDPAYTFDAGADCVYKAGIDWGTNRDELVNRVIYVYTEDDQTQTAVADLPDWSPWSYANVGYHATRRETMSELPDGGLQAAAEADLAASSTEQNDISFEAVYVPLVGPGDIVRYVNPNDYTDPVDCLCQVLQMDVSSLTPGAMTTYKLRILRWC